MANYKEIQGFPIQNLSSDPVPFAQAKENNPYAGVWSSGGNLNQVRNAIGGANSGTPSAGLAFGGYTGTTQTGDTEEYNGTSWSEQNNLNTARSGPGGVGVQTAAMAITGNAPPMTVNNEQYDGTSWTEVNNVNTARDYVLGGFGNNTAAVIGGGRTAAPATFTGNTESWDGTSWTEVNNLNNARSTNHSGAYNDGIAAGGYVAPPTGYNAFVETWNGTSWTETTEINTFRGTGGSSGASGSAFLLFGGESPPNPTAASKFTEDWNGTAWTEVNDLGTPHTSGVGGAGTNTVALAFGGSTAAGPRSAATEEWAFSGIAPDAPAAGYSDAITGQMYYNSTTGQFKGVNDGGVPIGTWASGGTLPRETYASAASGTVSATLLWGGYDDSNYFDDSLEFDGISWGSPVNMNVPTTSNRFGVGTQTATIAISGYNTTPVPGIGMPQVESYNGSAWTEIADVNTGVSGHGVAGSPSNAIKYGGTTTMVSPSSPTKTYEATTEQYDGTSWTEVADLNTAREGISFANQMPYTAGVAVGGANAPGAVLAIHEQWNGTAWTESTDLNEGRQNAGGSSDGTQTSMIIFGGVEPPASPAFLASNEFWNGTSWTEVNDLSAGRYGMGATGASSTNAMAIGNYPSQSNANTWEHFVAADFDITTLTTS